MKTLSNGRFGIIKRVIENKNIKYEYIARGTKKEYKTISRAMTKQKQSECKVRCTITASGHEKICYPFKGTFEECREYLYLSMINSSVTSYSKRNKCRNLRHFIGWSTFDNGGQIYLSVKRSIWLQTILNITFEIIENN